MRTTTGTTLNRIAKLEDRFGTGDGKPGTLLIVCQAGSQDDPAYDRYIEILRDSGKLPTGPIGLVDFAQLPTGLTEAQMERHLREHGAPIQITTE